MFGFLRACHSILFHTNAHQMHQPHLTALSRRVHRTPCNHTFCLECLQGWINFREQRDPTYGRQAVTCPLCREDLGAWRPDAEAIEASVEQEANQIFGSPRARQTHEREEKLAAERLRRESLAARAAEDKVLVATGEAFFLRVCYKLKTRHPAHAAPKPAFHTERSTACVFLCSKDPRECCRGYMGYDGAHFILSADCVGATGAKIKLGAVLDYVRFEQFGQYRRTTRDVREPPYQIETFQSRAHELKYHFRFKAGTSIAPVVVRVPNFVEKAGQNFERRIYSGPLQKVCVRLPERGMHLEELRAALKEQTTPKEDPEDAKRRRRQEAVASHQKMMADKQKAARAQKNRAFK
jgi:hypothetical protein